MDQVDVCFSTSISQIEGDKQLLGAWIRRWSLPGILRV
jgi:hypothetical protein